MKISDILSEEDIEVNLNSTNKEDVINELVDILHKAEQFEDVDEIRRAIFEREKLSSTGIGNGLAIPHAKVNQVKSIVAGIGISREGIDFESSDKLPTKIFFVLISPREDQGSHVKTLAKIAKIFKDPTWRQQLIDCKTSKEVVDFIKDKEKQIS